MHVEIRNTDPTRVEVRVIGSFPSSVPKDLKNLMVSGEFSILIGRGNRIPHLFTHSIILPTEYVNPTHLGRDGLVFANPEQLKLFARKLLRALLHMDPVPGLAFEVNLPDVPETKEWKAKERVQYSKPFPASCPKPPNEPCKRLTVETEIDEPNKAFSVTFLGYIPEGPLLCPVNTWPIWEGQDFELAFGHIAVRPGCWSGYTMTKYLSTLELLHAYAGNVIKALKACDKVTELKQHVTCAAPAPRTTKPFEVDVNIGLEKTTFKFRNMPDKFRGKGTLMEDDMNRVRISSEMYPGIYGGYDINLCLPGRTVLKDDNHVVMTMKNPDLTVNALIGMIKKVFSDVVIRVTRPSVVALGIVGNIVIMCPLTDGPDHEREYRENEVLVKQSSCLTSALLNKCIVVGKKGHTAVFRDDFNIIGEKYTLFRKALTAAGFIVKPIEIGK